RRIQRQPGPRSNSAKRSRGIRRHDTSFTTAISLFRRWRRRRRPWASRSSVPPHSPWQNAYVERFIVSLRRECLDHVIVLNAAGLRTIVKSYVTYYTNSRTHLWLGKDSPISRPISPVGNEPVIAIPEVGGLHHRYERRAAYSASSDLLHDRLQRLSRSIRAHRLTWRGARAATVRKSGGAFVDVVIVGRKAGTIVPAAWAAMRQAHWSRPTEFSAGTTPFPLRQLRLAARVPFIADRRLCHHDL